MRYKHDNPKDAYKEAQHLINEAKAMSAKRLELVGLGLTNIPSEISQLTSLQVLSLIGNRLTSVPIEITQLTNLQELKLYNNQLIDVPLEIGKLTNLLMLRLENNLIKTIPPEIAQLTNLQTLHLKGNHLTTIPPEIGQLIRLEKLHLRRNKLTKIPPEIGQLTNLVVLSLSRNELTTVPCEIAQLSNLIVLDLRYNSDLSIPEEIIDQWNNATAILNYLQALELIEKAKKKSSTQLDLKGFGLTVVPPELAKLTNLQVLFLNDNKLNTIPSEITELSKLRELSLSGNQLTVIPLEITQLPSLKVLYLYDNQLSEIPPEISRLTNLQMLNLGGNQLTDVPSEIARLTSLKHLHLDRNKLKIIPIEIAHLTKLQELSLSYNQLKDVPSNIAQLTNLKTLYLDGNHLTDIFPDIAQLINLEILNISSNHLTSIPLSIMQLINLEKIYLNANELTTIPFKIAQLTNLKELHLHENKLTTIPIEITHLTNLKVFWLTDNPDLPIPPEIVNQWNNPQAIFNYLREHQTRPLNEAKIILVGQGEVGKTSLVKRLLDRPFDSKEDQTKGISIEQWQLEVDRSTQGHMPIALNIWDFGGQEIMHATHQFFLTERSLYLLVIDARQGEDEGRLEYWLSLINSFADDAPVLVVINKIDQQRLDINRRGLQQKYPAIKGFVSTSARTEEGIDQLKTKIAAILAEMPHIDTPFPDSWQRVKEELTAMQTTRHFLPYQEYETVCLECGVKEESAQRTLVRFLHDLGIVLNFQDDPRVRETSVLNPHWVTDGVYALLNSSELQKQQGILRRDQLEAILPAEKYPPSQHRFLLDMMRKFELAYEMDWHSLLIPDLLVKEEPEFDWNNDESLQFAYQYQVLPRSILHRFMVRQYHLVDPDIRWRTGVVLRYDGLSALVKADIKASNIRISIDGTGDRRQFLYSLRLSFAGIHETITGIQPKEVVPIPGHPQAPPLLYSYLEKLEAMNMPDEQLFPGMDEVFSVQQLLNGVTTSSMRHSGLPSRTQIRNTLSKYFDKSEFYELLFEIDVNRKKLVGESVDDQMRECVLFMERNGRLAELVETMREARPQLDFTQRQ